jgi:hypothetical protein
MKIFKSNIPWLLVLVVLITSCEKTEVNYEPDRKTVVKIKDAENDITQKARDVLPTVDEFILIDVRRDPTRESDLNQPLTVKLVKDASIIAAYNTAHGTSFVELPAASYTLDKDISNITFAPGQDIVTVKIKLTKTGLSLSTQYALAYKLTEVGTGAVISGSLKQAMYAIGIKNKWDGVYRITGTFQDLTNAAFVGTYPYEWELQTNGPAQVIVIDQNNLGIPGFAFNSVGDPSAANTYYGSFGLVVNFDAATDKVASVVNYYGQPAANTRSAVLDDTGLNAYNNSTKQIDIKYFMLQPSVVPTPPNIRAKWNEQWKYIGSR